MSDNIWGYQPAANYTAGTDLIGYKVEATDGSIGKVDKHSDEVNSSYLVVDTGLWIFGKHVLLPAGTVLSVDPDEQRVFVDLTKDQIKHSPSSTRTSTSATPDTTSRSGTTTAATAAPESRHTAVGRGPTGESGRAPAVRSAMTPARPRSCCCLTLTRWQALHCLPRRWSR